MNTTEKSINQIITALWELEAKGCHSVFFEYGNGMFRVRIFKGETGEANIVFEKSVSVTQEHAELEKLYQHIDNMKYYIINTPFQCYRREFVKGKKSGKWEKTRPMFEFGENAMQAMMISGSGYLIDDPDNGLQYFVDYSKESETK